MEAVPSTWPLQWPRGELIQDRTESPVAGWLAAGGIQEVTWVKWTMFGNQGDGVRKES